MFRVISAILFFIILVLSFVFLQQNYEAFDQAISIHYNIILFKVAPVVVPVYVLMVLSWMAGVLLVFFLELIAWFRMRSKMAEQSKTIKRMEKELQDLRTLPFTDAAPVTESPPEE